MIGGQMRRARRSGTPPTATKAPGEIWLGVKGDGFRRSVLLSAATLAGSGQAAGRADDHDVRGFRLPFLLEKAKVNGYLVEGRPAAHSDVGGEIGRPQDREAGGAAQRAGDASMGPKEA